MKQNNSANILLSENVDEMLDFIEQFNKVKPSPNYRSWKDVAVEVDEVIKNVVAYGK